MQRMLVGFVAIVAGALLALASHWLIGVAVLIVGVLVVNSARRNAPLAADTGSGYDGGSSWSNSSSSDWNSSSNSNDDNRDCSAHDADSGGSDCGGDGGGGDGGGGGD